MLANELRLDGKSYQSARKEWTPAQFALDGLKQISSSYGDMIVAPMSFGTVARLHGF